MEMTKTYFYLMDIFKKLPYDFQDILEAWEEDPMKLFEMIRSVVEDELGVIRDVRIYRSYFNPQNMTAVVEYIVKFKEGTVGVKIVHAENPAKALMEYYEAERVGMY